MIEVLARLLAIRPAATTFAARGFALCDAAVRDRLERVLATFADGYNLALGLAGERLAAALRHRFDAHHLGFAFEGAGMALALRDLCTPWRPSRLAAFLAGPAREHDYITAVGAGFAVARLPWGPRAWASYAGRLDPLLAWCLPDGWGFHEGIFRGRRYFAGHPAPPPAGLPPVARQLFDSGLGRSLWWRQGAVPRRIRRAIERFPAPRRPEMWCGIGVAAVYAGGVEEATLLELRELAGPYRPDLLSGVPFAARMRQKGGNPSPVSDRACALLLGGTPDDAADWLVRLVEGVLADETLPQEVRRRDTYLLVRRRLVDQLHGSLEGERPCRLPAPREATTASS